MTEKTGIIFLQKDRFQLYSPYLSNILEFRFVSEVSIDFDLFNKPVFENLIKAFIVNSKIPAGNLIIVIADNASFIKDFTLTQTPAEASLLEDLRKQANEFIEHVPFEEVAGRTFPLANGIRAYATNKEMFEGIRSVLMKQGFIIEMVIPGFVFGQEVSSASILNINIINVIFQKTDLLKQYNLLIANSLPEEMVPPTESEDKEVQSEEPEGTNAKEPKEKKNLVLILGVAVIALIFIITGITLYLQFQQAPYKPPANVTVTKPVVTPQVVAQTTTAPVSISGLSVQIVSASESAATTSVRSVLQKYGFKSIDAQIQPNSGASTSLLIFSEKVGNETKTLVTLDIRKIIPTVLVQEKNDNPFDVSVIIGR